MQKSDPKKSYQLVEKIANFFQINGHSVERHEFMPNCSLYYRNRDINHTCYIAVDSIKYIISYYFVPSIKIPNEIVPQVAEFAKLANGNKELGELENKFEVDTSIKEIAYVVVRDWKQEPPTMQDVMDDIYTGNSMWNLHFDSFFSVLNAEMSPRESLNWKEIV